MGQLDGKVALITGAARGMGRSHAVRLAQEGADIIAVDACAPIDTCPYPLATSEDLDETVAQVEALDRRITAHRADVRDAAAMEQAVADGIDRFGQVDVVVANAGIGAFGRVWEITPEQWREMIDINLTGVFLTVRAAIPAMIERNAGGSLVLISSAAGLSPMANLGHYSAAKHGVTGLARSLAIELAPYRIRANSVHPCTVDTPLVQNDSMYALVGAQDRAQAGTALSGLNALPIPWIEASDVSSAVLWLASEESRYVTGIALPVDAGSLQPYKIPHQPPPV